MNWPTDGEGGGRAAGWPGGPKLRSPKAPPAVARGPGVRSLRAGWSGNDAFPTRLLLRTHPLSACARRRAGNGKATGPARRKWRRERAGAKWRLRRRRPGGSRGHFRFRSVAFFGCFPSARRLPPRPALRAPPGRRGGRAVDVAALRASARVCPSAAPSRRPRPGTLPVTPRPSGGRGLPACEPPERGVSGPR